MNESTKPMKDKLSKPITDHKQRGMSTLELLFAASTLIATVVVAGLTTAKRLLYAGD
jgi:hypothetical protein